MAAPTVSDLAALTGRAVSTEQGTAVLTIVTAMASAYTRGLGFASGVPCDEIRAVILTASARLVSNASGLLYQESEGPSNISYSSAFEGWSIAELFVLDSYRVKAR